MVSRINFSDVDAIMFCTKNPNVVSDIVNYKRWGDSSIVVECKNDIFYKVKYREFDNSIYVQSVSKEDVDKKFSVNG